MLDRCNGRGGAAETPIGFVPRAGDLNLAGLELAPAALDALLAVDAAEWRKEAADIRSYLGEYGARMPAALLAELGKLEKGLGA